MQGTSSPSSLELGRLDGRPDDPGRERDELIETEDLARYLWAARIAKGREVLDAGCGGGYGLGVFAEAGASRVLGFDLDPRAVERAASRSSEVTEALLADVTDLPFASGSFDLITCFEVVELVADRSRALDELRRVLRSDGHLVIGVRNEATNELGDRRPLSNGELSRLLDERFERVELYGQYEWLGTVIQPFQRNAPQAWADLDNTTHRDSSLASADADFVLAVASPTSELPVLATLSMLSSPLQRRWWNEQLADLQARNEQLAVAARRVEEVERLVESLTERLEHAELAHGQIADLQGHLREAEDIIRTFESSLLGRVGRLLYHLRINPH